MVKDVPGTLNLAGVFSYDASSLIDLDVNIYVDNRYFLNTAFLKASRVLKKYKSGGEYTPPHPIKFGKCHNYK
jgi:hypothetical protein